MTESVPLEEENRAHTCKKRRSHGHTAIWQPSAPQVEPSPTDNSANILILNFSVSKPMKNKHLLLNLPSLRCFALAVQAKTIAIIYTYI